jgi:hypothetical protein
MRQFSQEMEAMYSPETSGYPIYAALQPRRSYILFIGTAVGTSGPTQERYLLSISFAVEYPVKCCEDISLRNAVQFS